MCSAPAGSLLAPAPPNGGGGDPDAAPALAGLLLSDTGLYRLVARGEGRDAWSAHLALGNFARAREMAGAHAGKMEAVFAAEGAAALARGEGVAAAEAFARTRKPFEEVCLTLLKGGWKDALIVYLTRRWERLSRGGGGGGAQARAAADAGTQRSILCSWLLELHVEACGREAEGGGGGGRAAARTRAFLRRASAPLPGGGRPDLDKATALSLLTGHGLSPSYLFFCRLVGEWGRLVAHYVGRGEWAEAVAAIRSAPASPAWRGGGGEEEEPLDDIRGGGDEDDDSASLGRASVASSLSALSAAGVSDDELDGSAGGGGAPVLAPGSPNSQQELWFRHSSALLDADPLAVISGWRRCPNLDPARLVPTLVRHAAGGARRGNALDEALLFLEDVVRKGRATRARHRPLYNVLLTLYAAQPVGAGGDEGALFEFVARETERLAAVPPFGEGGHRGGAAAFGGDPGAGAPDSELLAAAEAGAAAAAAGGGDEPLDPDRPYFDLPFALRVCLPLGRPRTCVRLYCVSCCARARGARRSARSARPNPHARQATPTSPLPPLHTRTHIHTHTHTPARRLWGSTVKPWTVRWARATRSWQSGQRGRCPRGPPSRLCASGCGRALRAT